MCDDWSERSTQPYPARHCLYRVSPSHATHICEILLPDLKEHTHTTLRRQNPFRVTRNPTPYPIAIGCDIWCAAQLRVHAVSDINHRHLKETGNDRSSIFEFEFVSE